MSKLKPCMNKECDAWCDAETWDNCKVITSTFLDYCKHYINYTPQETEKPDYKQKANEQILKDSENAKQYNKDSKAEFREVEKSCESCGGSGVIPESGNPQYGIECPECTPKQPQQEPKPEEWEKKKWGDLGFDLMSDVLDHNAEGIQQNQDRIKELEKDISILTEFLSEFPGVSDGNGNILKLERINKLEKKEVDK